MGGHQKVQSAKQTNQTTRQRGPARPVRRGPVALTEQAAPSASSGQALAVLQRAIANPGRAAPADILALQRAAGNRAVTRLIQAKLMVGPAGDRYEQEADRVADQVLTMPAPVSSWQSATSRQPAVQRQAPEEEEEVQTKPSPYGNRGLPLAASITPLVQRQEVPEEEEEIQTKLLLQRQAEEEEEEVQTKPLLQRQAEEEEEELQTKSDLQSPTSNLQNGFEAGSDLEARLVAHKGTGSPLSEDVRAYMEPRFGADFSGVRVHTDGEAVQMNRELSAQAFTHGQDIYLGAGRYDPGTTAGKRLLAHELTHVVQQSGGGSNRISRWGGLGDVTSHEEVTEACFEAMGEEKAAYSEEAQEYLAGFSENMDRRGGFFATVGKGKMQQSLKKMAQDKESYESLRSYWRSEDEAPNHGEAGMYKANRIHANIARVNFLVQQAVAMWKGGDHNQSMAQLALALHAAQDRGAHGEGLPGLGHDPRRLIKTPPPEVKENYYTPGWQGTDCDKRSKNPEGWTLSIPYGARALYDFIGQLGPKAGEVSTYGKPGTFKRKMRGVGMFFGRNVKVKGYSYAGMSEKETSDMLTETLMSKVKEQYKDRGMAWDDKVQGKQWSALIAQELKTMPGGISGFLEMVGDDPKKFDERVRYLLGQIMARYAGMK
jgi:hypothetical protein